MVNVLAAFVSSLVSRSDKADFGTHTPTEDPTKNLSGKDQSGPYGTYAHRAETLPGSIADRMRPGARRKNSTNILRRSIFRVDTPPLTSISPPVNNIVFQDAQGFEDGYSRLLSEKEALEQQLMEQRNAVAVSRDELAKSKDAAKAIQRELDRVQALARAREDERRQVASQLSEAAGRENELRNLLTYHQQQLSLATSELRQLRALTGDNTDPQSLLDSFADVNDAVSDLAFFLVDSLGVGEEPIERENVSVLVSNSEWQFLQPFLEHCVAVNSPTDFVLVSVFQAVLHSILDGMIFSPFMPLQRLEADASCSAFILQVYDLVRLQERQTYSGRWRAITYRALNRDRNDGTLASDVARVAFTTLHDIASTLIPNASGGAASGFMQLQLSAARLVIRALAWQDLARGQFCEFDYSTFVPPPGAPFIETHMEEIHGARPSIGSTVLLTTSMGLRAFKTVEAETGLRPVEHIRSKARVVVAPVA